MSKEIDNSTLGRMRKAYETFLTLDGKTENDAKNKLKDDIAIYNSQHSTKYTLDDILSKFESMNKSSSGNGTRKQDKETREKMITDTQNFLSVPNLATLYNRGEVKLNDTQKIALFDKLAIDSDNLSQLLSESFNNIGGMTLIWSPYDNDKFPNPDKLLSCHVGGWYDNSPNLRYQDAPRKIPLPNTEETINKETNILPQNYSPRKVTSGKRSGYRDESFTPVVAIIPDDTIPDEKPKQEKPKQEKQTSGKKK